MLPAMPRPLVDIITTASNDTNNIYCFNQFLNNKLPPSARWKANSSLTIENPVDFLTIQVHSCPTTLWLSAITEYATREKQALGSHATPRKVPLYCSHITVTSTPLDGNTTPGPHRTAIGVLPLGRGLDISCLVISHHRPDIPVIYSVCADRGGGQKPQFHTCAGERENGCLPTCTTAGIERTQSRWESGALILTLPLTTLWLQQST